MPVKYLYTWSLHDLEWRIRFNLVVKWFTKNRVAVQAAPVLAILGMFVAKPGLLIAGQALPFMGQAASYLPTLVENAGVLGILELEEFGFIMANKYLPANTAT